MFESYVDLKINIYNDNNLKFVKEMKNEKDALEYIEILKKKYNFSVIVWEDDED